MRRDEDVGEGSPLSARALGIALGIWTGVLVAIAFVIVPMVFALCAPSPGIQ
jgi:hypothetical protein